MDRRYNYHDKEKDKQFNISSMTKYLKEKHEIDKELEKIITPYIESKKLRILDACCGVGHISQFLSKISPKSEFLGIDQTSYLIDEANKLSDNKNLRFETGDIYDMSQKYEKNFDISVCWKKEKGKNDFTLYYNVYSLPRFKKFVLEQGVKNIETYDFNIGIDIIKSDRDYMGTYTEKLENGKRLQISGAVVMFWKIIKIEL